MLTPTPAPVRHRTTAELEARLDHFRAAPRDHGTLDLLVSRPAPGERRVLDEGVLDLTVGLEGDRWFREPWKRRRDGSPDPSMQLNIMNARVSAFVAGTPDRQPLAGDQLHLDLDLSVENLPAGSRLAVGTAVIEITRPAHTGCKTFVGHYGTDAMRFVNGRIGRPLRLRGACARVVVPGTVRPGDKVSKVDELLG
jgi:hypothetical protein